MSNQTVNTDLTVRGGLPTIIPATVRPGTPRHQPNTPVNKKFAKTHPDKAEADLNNAAHRAGRNGPARHLSPPPPEPQEGDTHNGTATPSQTDGS